MIHPKYFLLLVFTFFFVDIVSSQSEFLNPTNTIPPKGSGFSLPKSNTPSLYTPGSTPKPMSSSTIETQKMQFAVDNKFKNPGDLVVEKLNQPEGGFDSKVFRKNQYLGDFKTKSAFVKISCRDFGEVDGDEIRVWVNDRVMIERVYLDSDYQRIELGLEPGFNKVDFEALNQGFSGPNTAQFMIFDDKGSLVSSNQWNLGTGFKATIIIVKE
jgi:hypothetical protein